MIIVGGSLSVVYGSLSVVYGSFFIAAKLVQEAMWLTVLVVQMCRA
jgi:hypothetical protein